MFKGVYHRSTAGDFIICDKYLLYVCKTEDGYALVWCLVSKGFKEKPK